MKYYDPLKQERKDLPSRGVLVGIQQLRQDPHLEMHTRGG